jgi:hypothetical protein
VAIGIALISPVHDPWEDGDKFIDVEAIRVQIRRLSNAELIREGRAARQLISPADRTACSTLVFWTHPKFGRHTNH